MPQASRSVVVNVTPDQMMKVIADYEKYPEFLPEVKRISVSNRTDRTVDVTYEIEVVKRLQYTLRLTTEGLVTRWQFVSGDLFKRNEGSWTLRAEPDGRTHATYSLEVAIGGFIPVPKALTDKLTEQSLPALLDNFKRRAEALFPPARA
jgi:ribosome-associated toxin RatA of RatAB toxin-antitoxin module